MYKHIKIMVISFIIAVCGIILWVLTIPTADIPSSYMLTHLTRDDIAYLVAYVILFYPYVGWSIITFLRSFVIFITYVRCRNSSQKDITHLPAVIMDLIMGLSVFFFSYYDYVVDVNNSPAFGGMRAVAICGVLLPLSVIFLIIDIILSIIEKKYPYR